MRPGDRARISITRCVAAALTLAAPALAFGQAASPQGATAAPPAQAIPGVGSAAAELPGATLPGEAPTALGPQPPELALWGVAAGIGETDNINLSQTDPKSQTIAATDLDFDLRRTGSGLDASALGNFTDLDYLQGAYSNQVLGRFDGLADVKFWSDRLKWSVADDYGEEETDAIESLTPANLQRVNVFTTGPDLTLRPSYSTFVNLGGRFSEVTYQTSPFDGHNLGASAEFGHVLSPLSSLSLVVQAEERRFDNTTVNTDYDRREAYAHYVIQGARTSIDAQLGATQANDTLNASWKTSPLARLSLTRRVSPFSLLTIGGGREYTDAANSFSSLSAGAGGGIAVAPFGETTGNYLRNYGSAGWEFSRERTNFGLTGTWERDTYDLQPVFDTTRAAVGFNLGRSLTPALSLIATGTVDRYDYFQQGFSDKFGTVGGGVVYRPGRWVIVYARYDHAFSRSSGVQNVLLGGGAYDENRVFIMVGYRPHSDVTEEGGGVPVPGGAPVGGAPGP